MNRVVISICRLVSISLIVVPYVVGLSPGIRPELHDGRPWSVRDNAIDLEQLEGIRVVMTKTRTFHL